MLEWSVVITTSEPGSGELSEIVRALREWPRDGAPVQLHPGDLGWFWRFGPEATAAAVRTWRREGAILAIGLLDGPRLLRLAMAPEAHDDEDLARQIVSDVTRPERGVLPEGPVHVEARFSGPFRDRLADAGWVAGEAWTSLRRDLTRPVEDCALRIEVVGPTLADERAAVQRAAFDGSTFTEERWLAMAAGAPYAEGRCLVGYDRRGTPVAAATVWSAGPSRPGLLEPMGVHRGHRGRGYATAIAVAAAATLQQLGSSSAVVSTPSANVAAVAAYRSAGFQPLSEVRDLSRV